MKKIILSCVLVLCAAICFSQKFSWNTVLIGDESSTISTMKVNEENLIFSFKTEEQDRGVRYKKIHRNGLLFFRLTEPFPAVVENQQVSPSTDMLVLAGHVIKQNENFPGNVGEVLFFGETAGYEKSHWCLIRSPKFYDRCYSNIVNCSSCLTEKHVSYLAENLMNCKPGTPWVEGAAGDGIGEGFTIALGNSVRSALSYLLLMNGYSSYEKPQLYKLNNRIKKIKVTGLRTGKSKVLDVLDTPHPQTVDISFLAEVEDIRVEIADVYKGTKFQDTCLNFCALYGYKVIPYETF